MLAVAEFTDMTKINVVLFIVIFLLNLLPAFAPPPWTAVSSTPLPHWEAGAC